MSATCSNPKAGQPGFVFDPYALDFAEDPYPTYRWMRDEAPVYYQPEMDFWVLSRYEDVWKAHRDASTFSSRAGPRIERDDATQVILLGMDAPKHNWAKAMMTRVFSPTRMEGLGGFVRSTVAGLLEAGYDKHGPDGKMDMVREFSVSIPLSVISELLGIPVDLRIEMHDLANRLLSREDGDDLSKSRKAMVDLWALFYELTKERRKAPKDDPISTLLAVEETDEEGNAHRLSDEEIAHRFLEMCVAGHETVAKAIPNGALAMHEFSDQRAKLAADLSAMPRAVHEILRFDPPSQLQGRITTEAVHLHGLIIPKNARVMLATGAATRDPRAFENPDVFDIDREVDSRTVAFGFGVHKCLGIHLAQQEIASAFEELFARFPDWQVYPQEGTRIALTNVRGVASLPMTLGRHV